MEQRKLKLIKNKDGHGTINYRVILPTKWISQMNLNSNEYVNLEFNKKEIIIKKVEENNMKLVKKDLGFYEFQDYVENFEKDILNVDGVVTILSSDLDEEIPFSNGVRRREYWGKGKRGATKIKKDLLYRKYFSEKYECDIFEIYEYED